MALPTATLDGIRYYEASDSDNPRCTYLLLHGLGNSLDFWTAVAPVLAGVGRTVAIDMPGFGQSRPPSGPFTLSAVSNEVMAFMKKREISSCVIVAHSLGGFIAADLASREPEVCVRLVMVDSVLIRASEVLKNARNVIERPFLTFFVALQFALGMFPIPRALARLIGGSKIVRRLLLWPFVVKPARLDAELITDALSNNGGLAVLRTLFQAKSIDYVEFGVST